MPSLPASPTSTASAEDHSDSRDTHKSSSSPATTKKKRLRRKALSEEEDIAILKAVAQIQPHKAKHGRGRRVWDETAAVYKELTGDEMTPVLVRGRYENLIKRYNMVLEGRGKREWIMSDEFKKLMEDAYADRAILIKTDKSEPESAASGQGVGEGSVSTETAVMEDTDAPPLKRGRGPTVRAHVRAVKSALGKRSEPASPPISNVGPRQTKPRTVDMPLTTANTPTKDAVAVAAPTQQPKVEPTQTVQDQRTDTAATATPPTARPTIPAPTPPSATAPTPPATASAPTPAPAPAPALRGTTVTRSAGRNSPAQTTPGATPSILTRPSQLVVQREFTPPPKPAVLDRQRNTNKQPLQALSRSHSLTTPNQQPGVPNEVLRQQSLEVQRNALFGAAMNVMASGASSKAPSPPPPPAQPSNVPPATAQPIATPMSVAYLSVVNSTASSSTPTVDSSKQTPSSTATSSATVTAAPGKNPVAPSVAPPTRNTSQSNGAYAVPAPVPAATVPKSSATPTSTERPTYYPPRYLLPSVQNGARHPMPGGVMVPHRTRSEVPMDLEVPKSPAAPPPAQKNKPESSNTPSRPLTAAAAAEALTEESADVDMLDDHRSFVKSTIVAVCDRLKEMEKMWIQEADRRRTTQDQAAQNTLRAHLSSARSSSQQGTTTPNAQQSGVDIGKDVNTALVAEVVSLREALSRGVKERQELENELASVAALAREADDERTQLRQQVTQLSEQFHSQQRQYQTLHSDFTSLATQLKDLGSVAKMIKDMETAHGNLQRSLQTHEKDVSYQQVDIKKFQHEVRVELDALGSTVRENTDKQTQLASQIADTQHDMESQFKLVSRALDEERKQRELQHTELLSGIRDIVAADEL